MAQFSGFHTVCKLQALKQLRPVLIEVISAGALENQQVESPMLYKCSFLKFLIVSSRNVIYYLKMFWKHHLDHGGGITLHGKIHPFVIFCIFNIFDCRGQP